jgi:glycogen phosphorylase
MSTKSVITPKLKRLPKTPEERRVSELLKQYGCGPIAFAGSENAFYERHLVFDRVIDPRMAAARERFEAFSHSIRDVLAQRWVLTRNTHNKVNPRTYLALQDLAKRELVGR